MLGDGEHNGVVVALAMGVGFGGSVDWLVYGTVCIVEAVGAKALVVCLCHLVGDLSH